MTAADVPFFITTRIDQRPSGFMRSSMGPWQHGQIWGDRTLIEQTSQ
jgi:hypothetical protein